jgi:hypothetical protein
MQARVGDEILIRGQHVGDPERHGVIVEVRGDDGQPPYTVRWDDGHEGLLMPSFDATVKPQGSG